MAMASVVLPRPGGPSNRMCPSVSLRLRDGIERDLEPGRHLALPDHVANPLRPERAIFVFGDLGRRATIGSRAMRTMRVGGQVTMAHVR